MSDSHTHTNYVVSCNPVAHCLYLSGHLPFLFHLPHFCHRHSELHFSIYLGTDSDLDPKKKKNIAKTQAAGKTSELRTT